MADINNPFSEIEKLLKIREETRKRFYSILAKREVDGFNPLTAEGWVIGSLMNNLDDKNTRISNKLLEMGVTEEFLKIPYNDNEAAQ